MNGLVTINIFFSSKTQASMNIFNARLLPEHKFSLLFACELPHVDLQVHGMINCLMGISLISTTNTLPLMLVVCQKKNASHRR